MRSAESEERSRMGEESCEEAPSDVAVCVDEGEELEDFDVDVDVVVLEIMEIDVPVSSDWM